MKKTTSTPTTDRNGAVIFARVSSTTDRQDTTRQVADLNAYATANGLPVLATFEEHISGATKNTDRQKLQECITYCKEHDVAVLLCSEMSRLSRSVWELQETLKDLRDNGINVYFQKEGLSLFNADGQENPMAVVAIAILGVAAQIERENIAYRLNSGRAQAIAKGKRMGRPTDTKETVDQIREKYPDIVSLLQRGKSVRDVAARVSKSKTTVQKVKTVLGL